MFVDYKLVALFAKVKFHVRRFGFIMRFMEDQHFPYPTCGDLENIVSCHLRKMKSCNVSFIISTWCIMFKTTTYLNNKMWLVFFRKCSACPILGKCLELILNRNLLIWTFRWFCSGTRLLAQIHKPYKFNSEMYLIKYAILIKNETWN